MVLGGGGGRPPAPYSRKPETVSLLFVDQTNWCCQLYLNASQSLCSCQLLKQIFIYPAFVL